MADHASYPQAVHAAAEAAIRATFPTRQQQQQQQQQPVIMMPRTGAGAGLVTTALTANPMPANNNTPAQEPGVGGGGGNTNNAGRGFSFEKAGEFLSGVQGWWGSLIASAGACATNQVLVGVILMVLVVVLFVWLHPPFAQRTLPGQHPLEEGPLDFAKVFTYAVITVVCFFTIPILTRNAPGIALLLQKVFNGGGAASSALSSGTAAAGTGTGTGTGTGASGGAKI